MSTTQPLDSAVANELKLARQVQTSLLPERSCCLGSWESAYSYEPAGAVGGDYIDLIPSELGAFFFALGDVSGKGIAASMLMSHLHATLRALLSTGMSIEETLKVASRTFCNSSMPAQFATLVLGRADQSGNVDLLNAGHTPVLLSERDAVRVFEAADVPLGLFCLTNFGSVRLQVRPGSSLLLYSDGITESLDSEGNEYGITQLMEDLRQSGRYSPPEIVEFISRKIVRFTSGSPLTDDRTILVLGRWVNGRSATGAAKSGDSCWEKR